MIEPDCNCAVCAEQTARQANELARALGVPTVNGVPATFTEVAIHVDEPSREGEPLGAPNAWRFADAETET
mgnify:CR=1 FL=1